jgi:hypothetical protein
MRFGRAFTTTLVPFESLTVAGNAGSAVVLVVLGPAAARTVVVVRRGAAVVVGAGSPVLVSASPMEVDVDVDVVLVVDEDVLGVAVDRVALPSPHAAISTLRARTASRALRIGFSCRAIRFA